MVRTGYLLQQRCHLQRSRLAWSTSLPSFSSFHGTLWPLDFRHLAVTVILSANGLGYHWMASAFVHALAYLRRPSLHLHCLPHCLHSFVVLVSVNICQLLGSSAKAVHGGRHAWLIAFLKLFVEVRPLLGASSLSPESLDESISPYPT